VCFTQRWIRQDDVSIQEKILGLDVTINDSTLVDELELVDLEISLSEFDLYHII